MQVNAILGVDISKKKLDACLLIDNKERHKVFHNNKEGFEKLGVIITEQSLFICA
ncbi:Transposase IS116/IS110/IS902 family protein [Wolbachia endosymbiont of Cylisticus convexus]|uniref:IS110 family transposase n=1 Tax=Wolbachia endosymbiont of Cylisticus convexus TaxID=118728 RepID=UPI000E1556D5|nr:IS110 family transposase [Wolbachia endosymbiont of Cylisticus convexus]RDD33930.1 Transposase [Wolbachia endosymbiont of Cylisticus convexus]RDD34003.1 Transposase [Wolbachia endosymbiont of Cylisticus convexus]RDD34363.1 IS110 family transposase [Wolbachia endosymbiont of Cylisticus convexus]RDD34680.1 IS110 family transposase [Wolbachia endosymbiont of Cylisticus convexus]RDD34739.1 Transposase IS116/IS110/IS902 family protein [Wolbachia endosymbiont of Cylisticus convexus]